MGFLGPFELEIDATPAVDSDGDGLPDAWKNTYFGHPTAQAGDQSPRHGRSRRRWIEQSAGIRRRHQPEECRHRLGLNRASVESHPKGSWTRESEPPPRFALLLVISTTTGGSTKLRDGIPHCCRGRQFGANVFEPPSCSSTERRFRLRRSQSTSLVGAGSLTAGRQGSAKCKQNAPAAHGGGGV